MRRLLKRKILKNHHGFNHKYIKDLEVNITLQSLSHGLKKKKTTLDY